MKRLASLLLLAPPIAFLGTAACAHKPKTAPIVPTSSINDCALISAIGQQHYKLSRSDPPRRIKLNGEDLRWTPGCDWSAMGFNVVDAKAASDDKTTGQIEFHRPHYDSQGAEVRVAMAPPAGAEVKELCRVKASGDKWEVTKCEPDPKASGKKMEGPKPSDTTPERLPKPPSNRLPQAPTQDPQTPG